MKLKLKEQNAPNTVKFELSEGCNLGCGFCALRGIREKGLGPYFFMTVETAERIAKEMKRVGWKSKIVFSMHGEPTANPKIFDIVLAIRKHLPDNFINLISNSYGIAHHPTLEPYQFINRLEEVGVNNVILDIYDEVKGDWKPVMESCEKHGRNDFDFLQPNTPMFNAKKGFRMIFVEPIRKDANNNITRKLYNHAGVAAEPDFSANNKRCAMPFREMAIRYNGNVALCCDDFRGAYPIASIMEMPIDKVWNHERFQAARIMLYNRDRTFKPCHGCNNISSRVGLLPDKRGMETLPEITPEVRKLAEDVSKNNKPFGTILVQRKWEASDYEDFTHPIKKSS